MRDRHRAEERVDPLVLGAGADPQQLTGVATRRWRGRKMIERNGVREDGQRSRHGRAMVGERRRHPIGLGLADRDDPGKAEQLAVGGSRLRPAQAIAQGGVVLGDDERHAQLARQRQRSDAIRQPVVGVDHLDGAAVGRTPRGQGPTERQQRGRVAGRHVADLGPVETTPCPDHRQPRDRHSRRAQPRAGVACRRIRERARPGRFSVGRACRALVLIASNLDRLERGDDRIGTRRPQGEDMVMDERAATGRVVGRVAARDDEDPPGHRAARRRYSSSRPTDSCSQL
jgi:hypothetical protein